MSLFKKKPAPKPASAPAQIAVVTRPPTLNPTQEEERSFASWRIGHLDRWLAHPMNKDADPAKRAHLEAERDMYAAKLRMKP